jgi:NAD(P)-dependent dehydrogenase (short-subunit alcohol dehydrogenase family)
VRPGRAAQLVDAALEASVVGSFTRIGYLARRRLFDWPPLDALRLDNRVAVVTGATSGLGLATATALARQGAAVCIVGRNRERTERAQARIAATGAPVEAEVADLSLLGEARSFAERFAERHERLDVLVHNAGALTHTFTMTGEGNEVTLATHVLTPFLLTHLLLPLLEAAAPSRVVLVASGGMYTQPLDVAALVPTPDSYDGVKAYARCKRAQVALAGAWAGQLAGRGVTVSSMHPGWADTPGLERGLPRFRRLIRPVLRTPEQGADTIVWLAAAPEALEHPGAFYLDRRPRPIHRLSRTRRPDEAAEAERLSELCASRISATSGGRR